jgi:hypothetical protein
MWTQLYWNIARFPGVNISQSIISEIPRCQVLIQFDDKV